LGRGGFKPASLDGLSPRRKDRTLSATARATFRLYDRRGFGRSDQPWQSYEYDTLADDLAAVIEQTGAQDATLVGFSMAGGEVARYLSRHAGKGVAQAALISSVVPYMAKREDNPNGVDADVFGQMLAGIKQDRAHFFAGFFKDFFGAGLFSNPVSSEFLESMRNVAMQASLKATLDCVMSFATTDFRSDLNAFSVPTLIVHGTSDKTVPIDATGRTAARGISNSTLLESEDAPHGLFATHKDRLTQDLLEFLRGR
jgi:pimeloyl-ACP methyl ester carboxylesterase